MGYSLRFIDKIDMQPDGCWLWTAGTNSRGYGKYHIPPSNVAVSAHRYSYEAANGAIPDELVIRHLCNVKRCVNPDHLQAGTARENYQDSIENGKHRNLRGTG